MTFLLFGVLANQINDCSEVTIVDKNLQWGVAVGIIGFAVGLLTVTAGIKRDSHYGNRASRRDRLLRAATR